MATLIINTGEKAFSREPALEGVGESLNKIWSKNTGRTSTGKMTGDIVTKKRSCRLSTLRLQKVKKWHLKKRVMMRFFR